MRVCAGEGATQICESRSDATGNDRHISQLLPGVLFSCARLGKITIGPVQFVISPVRELSSHGVLGAALRRLALDCAFSHIGIGVLILFLLRCLLWHLL